MLTSYIDPANIPKKYGGTLEFGWGDMPNLDPVIVDTADWEGTAKENPAFPKGPAYWRPIDGGRRLECVAVGSVDKKERCERVCTIPVPFYGEEEVRDGDAVVAGAAAANGAAVPPAVVTTTAEEAKDAPAPATTEAPAAAASATLDPAAATSPTSADPVSPADEEFKTPLGSPLVGATQQLSLEDEKKKPNGNAEAVPNGKPVAAS